MRVELVPLPHRPPLATNDTLQVPLNLADSAKAGPDRMTPALSASATTDVLSMGCVPLLEDAGLPGFDLMGLEGRERGRLLAVKAGAVPGRNTLPQRLGFL